MPRPWNEKYVDSIPLLLIVFAFSRVLSLTCLKAEYQIGQECCPKCPAGNRVNKHCTEYKSTSCLPCDDGTFMDQLTGQITCFPCTRCDSGSGLKVKRPCTSFLDVVCEPQEGYYCTDSKDASCGQAQKHRTCDKGQYVDMKGTSSRDTVCSHCTEGTFSDGTFDRCQPHTQCESLSQQLLNPGTSSTDAECKENGRKNHLILIPVVVIILFTALLAGSAAFYIHKKRNKNKERRQEPYFSNKRSRDESITLNAESIPNIEADLEVHCTEETKGQCRTNTQVH